MGVIREMGIAYGSFSPKFASIHYNKAVDYFL